MKFLGRKRISYMQTQFYRLGTHVINFANITFINRGTGDTVHVHFVGMVAPLTFQKGSVEAKALLHWWENSISEMTDGTEGIPGTWT